MSLFTVTDSLIGKVTGGAIFGPDGGIWSATQGFYGNQKEFSAFATAFLPNSDALYKGLTFQNELYVVTSVSKEIVVAQKNNTHLVIANCNRCFVAGFHDEQISFSTCYDAIASLANAINSHQYDDIL